MLQFILGLFIGSTVSLFLYAVLIGGRGDDIDNERRK